MVGHSQFSYPFFRISLSFIYVLWEPLVGLFGWDVHKYGSDIWGVAFLLKGMVGRDGMG